jgi:NAD(P)-dependent dehydrogenase (short-subunit alcohol dehydrogenase family)
MNPKANYDFTGKVIFITGASTGIGRATALGFAKSKAKVMVADVNTDAGWATVQMIREKGGTADFVKCDVSQETDVKNAIEQTVKTFGGLDGAFNNAGIEGESSPTADCTSANWQKVLQINLSGVWYCMKYEIAEMLKHGGGTIVNCSSIAGLVGFPGAPAYVAAKHGVVGLTKTAALDYAKLNIRVNAVCPGVIMTPMIDRFAHGSPAALQQLSAGEPVGRMGHPEEIGESVLWLCSEASSFVTGQAIAVDGGWVAQ